MDEIIHSDSVADQQDGNADLGLGTTNSMLISLNLNDTKPDRKKLLEEGRVFEEFESSQASSRRSNRKPKRIIGIDDAGSDYEDQQGRKSIVRDEGDEISEKSIREESIREI